MPLQQAFRNQHARALPGPSPWYSNQQHHRGHTMSTSSLSGNVHRNGCVMWAAEHPLPLKTRAVPTASQADWSNPLSSLCPSDQAGCGSASPGPSWNSRWMWLKSEAPWRRNIRPRMRNSPEKGCIAHHWASDLVPLTWREGAIKIAGALPWVPLSWGSWSFSWHIVIQDCRLQLGPEHSARGLLQINDRWRCPLAACS